MTDPVVWTEPVLDEWIDYNGHLSEPYYVLVFGHATDAVMEHVGLGPEHRARAGASLFTVEAHVRYLDQVPAGADLEVQSAVIGATGEAAVDLARAAGRRNLAGDRGGPRRARRHGGRALVAVPGRRRGRIDAALVPPPVDAAVVVGADQAAGLDVGVAAFGPGDVVVGVAQAWWDSQSIGGAAAVAHGHREAHGFGVEAASAADVEDLASAAEDHRDDARRCRPAGGPRRRRCGRRCPGCTPRRRRGRRGAGRGSS